MQITTVRRVVTGHDDNGQAVVVADDIVDGTFHRPDRPVALTDLWAIASVPVTGGGKNEPKQESFSLAPPKNGVVFRVVQFDPEPPGTRNRTDGSEVFAAMGAGGNHVASRHPYMHRTNTVDFAIVLQGSITMLLDQEDVELSAGDVVIQRCTNHAWSNRGTKTCLVAFILVDARLDP
ncbi:cupin domain-containing protein [Streptomyces malaysiensis]|uniref:cupin domain-containing protein n=1 Tax=Streptomyces malaysiensis TaxID=92644 RepID=UPI002B2B1CCB|nr:cupin domain-containing protein [Streptomyces malaysiensis]